MEQLKFCFGSTLGTENVLFRLIAGRVCLKLHKGDFTSFCNSVITEPSLGYARQIWPPVFLVCGGSSPHLAYIRYMDTHSANVSLHYAVHAVQ